MREPSTPPAAAEADAASTPAKPVPLKPISQPPVAESAAEPEPPMSLALKPLSSFSAKLHVEEPFRPLLEVDRFQWPAECDTLADRAGGSIGKFARQLISQVAQGKKIVRVVGAAPGAGCTTAVLTLARTLAQRGASCVVLDANFRAPRIARRLGVAAQHGWDDTLSGELPLAEVLVASIADGLAIVPLRDHTANWESLTSGLRAMAALATLRDHYDVVLIDAGAFAGDSMPDNAATAGMKMFECDATYVIYDARAASETDLTGAQRHAESLGSPVMGLLENFSAADELQVVGD